MNLEKGIKKTKIIVFSAPWCAACQPYKEMLENAGIEFTEIDVEKDIETANKNNIKSLPTTFIFKSEDIIAVFTQVVSIEEIKRVLEDFS